MTTPTAVREAVRLTGTYPTVEQRREALKTLAQEVDLEERCKNPTWWPVCVLIVPTLAAAAVQDPTALFVDLVFATAEFRRFVGNETDWLSEHELGTSAEVAANVYERLEQDIDFAADRLMGTAS
jgi:hypothetical protein